MINAALHILRFELMESVRWRTDQDFCNREYPFHRNEQAFSPSIILTYNALKAPVRIMTKQNSTLPSPSYNSKESLINELKGIAGKTEQRVKEGGKLVADAHLLSERACQAAAVSQTYVHANPWKVISIAAAVGALIGVLIGRR